MATAPVAVVALLAGLLVVAVERATVRRQAAAGELAVAADPA